MSENNHDFRVNNSKIARNTILLYARTFLVMIVSLYTSRILLKALGIDDFGIYQVVGGMVSMFSIISSSLSTSISRFITYEIGTGNTSKLKIIFSTSMMIQIVISIIVVLIAEVLGLWFLQTKMQIPEGSLNAAIWVFHCSVATFVINLLSIPFTACIIAHEHMKAFAYISVLEVFMKLGVSLLITLSPISRLIMYAILMALNALIIRLIYTIYCRKHFQETNVKLLFDRSTYKSMFSLAGWSFFSNAIHVLNTQGVNVLINVYFGVVFNAARGIATQVESAVGQFVSNFTMAINPQITKSYATGDFSGLYQLVCRGAKFSYFLTLIIIIPLIAETEVILTLWLGDGIPPHSVQLVRLSLILCILDAVGNSGYTACVATGNLKKYALVISLIAVFEFPLSLIAFKLGGVVESCYYIYIVVKVTVLLARIFLLSELIGLKAMMYIKNVLLPIVLTTVVAIFPSILIVSFFQKSYIRLFFSLIVGVLSSLIAVLYIGMTKSERSQIVHKIISFIKR